MENERAGQSEYGPITEDEVNAAQTAWCDALITIGQFYNEGGDYEAVADRLIDDLYDYTEGTVFFKPTLAFRRCSDGKLRLCTHKSALPYDPAK